jgi:hypothetical protein
MTYPVKDVCAWQPRDSESSTVSIQDNNSTQVKCDVYFEFVCSTQATDNSGKKILLTLRPSP